MSCQHFDVRILTLYMLVSVFCCQDCGHIPSGVFTVQVDVVTLLMEVFTIQVDVVTLLVEVFTIQAVSYTHLTLPTTERV